VLTSRCFTPFCRPKVLADEIDDLRLYGRAFADVIPHLTVADRVDGEKLHTVEASIRPALPIKCLAKEVAVFASDDAGMWSKKASFLLSTATLAG